MPLAFAMALDMPVADLLAAIGHDGSEIVFPSLPEPLCRRCFHVQELIQVALSRGLAVTPVELFPVLQPTEAGPFHKTVLYPDNNWRRFEADDPSQSWRDCTAPAHVSATRSPTTTAASTTLAARSTTTPASPARPTSSTPAAPGGLTPLENAPMSNQYNELLVSQMSEPLDAEKKRGSVRACARRGRGRARRNDRRQHAVGGRQGRELHSLLSGSGPSARRSDQRRLHRIGQGRQSNGRGQGHEIRGQLESDRLHRHVDQPGIGRVDRRLRTRFGAAHARRIVRAPKGEELTVPTVCNVVPERFEVPSYEKELEMRDLIESCCTCDEERTFVAMREAGHTLAEIAAAIDRSRSFTYRMGKALDARVQRKSRPYATNDPTHLPSHASILGARLRFAASLIDDYRRKRQTLRGPRRPRHPGAETLE